MIVMSDRLKRLASLVQKGETVADIGTDHGYLPLFLCQKGTSPRAVLIDVNAGPLAKAKENSREEALGNRLDFRLGDGLEPLKKGEVDCCILAGMGGLLIAELLDWDLPKTITFRKYILQPRNHVGKLIYWLTGNGFRIEKETLVKEGPRFCEILVCRPPAKVPVRQIRASLLPDLKLEDPAFEYPDLLVEKPCELTRAYLAARLSEEEAVINRIRDNRTGQDGPGEGAKRELLYREGRRERLLALLASDEKGERKARV